METKSKPIRVLMIFTIMNRGGAETMIMNYYRNIDRTKVQFDFVVHRPEKGAYDDEIRKLGGRIFVFPAVRPSNFSKYKKQIRAFLDKHPEYTIIHSHAQELAYYFYKIAYEKGVPYIITHSHNASMLWDIKAPLRILWRKIMFKYINVYFSCGQEAAKHYYGRKRAQQSILMHNAINVEDFKYNESSRCKIRKEWKISENEYVIGHVGRFSKQKNHPFILKVFDSFLKKHPNSRLMLVGEEDNKQTIRERAKELGIEKRVIFAGLRADIPEILSALDCILMPSLFEGVSVAMIEEQASGLPLITSDKVPNEVGLLPSTEFIPLEADINVWVSELEKYRNIPRNRSAIDVVRHAGYDIKTNAAKLQEYYLTLSKS